MFWHKNRLLHISFELRIRYSLVLDLYMMVYRMLLGSFFFE